MKAVIFLGLIGLAACTAKYEFLEEWNLWKDEHGKSYGTELEEIERHIVWLSNKKYIEQHNANADIFGFTLAMNHFGDISDREFMEKLGGYVKPSDSDKANVKRFSAPVGESYPDELDWRSGGAVTSVRNEGYYCKSSYAFSAMGALEGAWALANHSLVTLSVQNIIDCSVPFGNSGCRGGNMYSSYLYVLANEGVDREDSYPYSGKQCSCSCDSSKTIASMTGMVMINSGKEEDLLAAIVVVGPIAAAIDAYTKAFRFYQSGVFDSYTCSNYYLNQAVLVTGYGTYSGKDYWLVKNSWGTNWGMSGYIMMARNKSNQCGIATDAFYPTL